MNQPADLLTLIPTSIPVLVCKGTDKEETINISPFVWKQFREVAKLIQPISFSTDEAGDLKLMELVSNYGEEVTDIICVAARKPREWVDELDLVDLLLLAATTMKVNRDFFSQTLAPQLRELAAKLSSGAE